MLNSTRRQSGLFLLLRSLFLLGCTRFGSPLSGLISSDGPAGEECLGTRGRDLNPIQGSTPEELLAL